MLKFLWTMMLINYLKLSIRLLTRRPFLNFIDILGLSIGFASFFVLWQHASTELNTDRYHKDADRIVRVGLLYRWSEDGVTYTGQMTSGAIRSYQAPMIDDDFASVQDFTRILQQAQFNVGLVGHSNEVVISVMNNGFRELFTEERAVYADPNLFEFFTIPLLQGAKENVLRKPGSVVLSEARARQFFGDRDPLGEILMINDTLSLTVTGVFVNLPATTHLAFDVVISNVGLQSIWLEEIAITSTYFKLKDPSQIPDFRNAIETYGASKYFLARDANGPSLYGLLLQMFVQPLTEIAFSEPYEFDYRPQTKSRSVLIILKIVSLLIIAMACINHINLAIPGMMKRMKEVAARKVSGARFSDFTRQFIVETAVTTGFAIAVALTIVQLVRIPASTYMGIHVPEFALIESKTWIAFATATVAVVLITGLYPLTMSAYFNPGTLLTISRKSPGRKWVQSLLTIGQYSTSTVLILWAFASYLQLEFILGKDLGIRREEMLVVSIPPDATPAFMANVDSFVGQIREEPGVLAATSSVSVVGDLEVSVLKVGTISLNKGMDTNGGVDESFIPCYGIRLIAGRNFNPGDHNAVIVSRHAAKRLGFAKPEDAVGFAGVTITVLDEGRPSPIHIVGVIEDYRFKSFVNAGKSSTEAVTGRGICLTYKNRLVPWYYPRRVSVRVEISRVDEALAEIERNYKVIFPGSIFNWYFLNDHINRAYNNDKTMLNQIALFTCISIAISCLGLLGMVTVIAEEKIKEFGIRKVLGATGRDTSKQLVKTVFVQICISGAVALPLSYFLINRYMERFVEKIALQWWHFVFPVVLLVLVMVVTISFVLVRVARQSPVESLRYE